MKIAFFSNFLTHQQVPFCEELLKIEDIEFYFVANEKIPDERISLGYEDMNAKYPFVIRPYESENEQKKAQDLADNADVVIIGSSSMHYFKKRLKNKKLTFRYTERVFKDNKLNLNLIKTIVATKRANGFHKMYLLAASAFAAKDYARIGLFKNRVYKWGYFTEVYIHDNIDQLIANKNQNSLIWVGRLIDVKHPQHAIEVAKKLKEDGFKFTLNIIGNGVLEDTLKKMINDYQLNDCVFMLGSMSPSQVREYMDKSEIYLFTSDRGEGWGTVLNESMNSGCAVISSHSIGSVPFLIKHNQNGIIYENGNIDDLYKNVSLLLNDDELKRNFGKNAYDTMINEWSPKVAANRFVELTLSLINKSRKINLYQSGPCSKAICLKDDWFTNKKGK